MRRFKLLRAHSAVDIGIDACLISHNWGCQMAGSWMANLGGY